MNKKIENKVLFIEDEDFLREKTTEILNIVLSKEVLSVKTADDAQELFLEHEFDLLICDIKTPGKINGLEFIKKAKETKPDISSIVISGFSHIELRNEAKKIGVDKYFVKPISLDVLLEEINQI